MEHLLLNSLSWLFETVLFIVFACVRDQAWVPLLMSRLMVFLSNLFQGAWHWWILTCLGNVLIVGNTPVCYKKWLYSFFSIPQQEEMGIKFKATDKSLARCSTDWGSHMVNSAAAYNPNLNQRSQSSEEELFPKIPTAEQNRLCWKGNGGCKFLVIPF